MNITDSELVLVEDSSLWDTNAVILKSTAIVTYNSMPRDDEKLFFCNLSHCELFSCILGMEEETALSIIDPVGATLELWQNKCLEVQLQPFSVRLSYHDVAMFTRMLSSLPKQTLWAKQNSNGPPANAKSHVNKLTALGFAEVDCEVALDQCNGHLDDAALWLTQNAVPNGQIAGNDVFFKVLELQSSCVKICVIDDCRDADVPLVECTLMDLSFKQESDGPGTMSGIFGVDYYNRVLSGWEPFIEPWRANVEWEESLTNSLRSKRLQVKIDSENSVNINVTSTLVELVTLVKHNWTQDYYLTEKDSSSSQKTCGNSRGYRMRSPFVPFALKNDTGSRLKFQTFIATADNLGDKMSGKSKSASKRDTPWLEVTPGSIVPFTFEERGKLRHHSTHITRRHQIAVTIDGWSPIDPVTVDQVGTYFRHSYADVQDSQVKKENKNFIDKSINVINSFSFR